MVKLLKFMRKRNFKQEKFILSFHYLFSPYKITFYTINIIYNLKSYILYRYLYRIISLFYKIVYFYVILL